MSDSKVFVFRMTSTLDDHENHGTFFVTLPTTMETVNFLTENGQLVVRLREANILPEGFSSLGVALDAEIWWDSTQAEYEMDSEPRIEYIDKLESEVLDHEVCTASRNIMLKALKPDKFGAVVRFYISGDSFTVTGVLPIAEGHLCISRLMTCAQFGEAIARGQDPKVLEEAGLA